MIIKKDFSGILNFLSGFVILTFGMLALYSAVLLIHARDNLNVIYFNYAKNVLALQEHFYAFEVSYDALIAGKEEGNISEVRQYLQNVNKSLWDIQRYKKISFEIESGRQESKKNTERQLIENLQIISQIIGSLDEESLLVEQEKHLSPLIISIGNMDDAIKSLKKLVYEEYKNRAFSTKVDRREQWLYWSVIAMGLSGFVLAVINASRVNQLRRVNKEKAKTLETLENRLSALDLARDGVLIVNSDDNISYVNKSLCTINGINLKDRDRLIKEKWLGLFSDSDREIIEEDILPKLNEAGYWTGSFPLYRLDGSVVYTEMSLTKLPDGGKIGTFQDVSERRNVESEKQAIEEQFYQAQKMEAVGRLAGGIAHDFNNILAAMNGYAEMLTEDLEPDTTQHKFAQNILQAGMQGRSLVDQMLAFSRSGSKETECIDLVACVDEAISMLQATLPKSIQLHNKFLVPQAFISGNATQLSQLIMNLCVNARDAMEEDRGQLGIEVESLSAEDIGVSSALRDDLPDAKESPPVHIEEVGAGHSVLYLGHLSSQCKYVRLRVYDTGTGMSHVIMEHVFEPFFTTKSVDKGTGLGLSTVLGIVVSHQGFMVMDSTIGKGTCFDLYFPLTDTMQEDVSDKIHMENEVSRVSKDKKHILLVEDEQNVSGMIMERLKRLGYDASHASSGMDGLDMVRENPDLYDLVITDYNMPQMTGLEMVQQIHMDLPDLPFILLSGYSEDKMMELIAGNPAIKEILRKPVSGESLALKINGVLDGHARNESA